MPSISPPIRPIIGDVRSSKRARSPQHSTGEFSRPQKTRILSKSTNIEPKPRRFACPFYKNDPVKYRHHQICCGPGWLQFHRVKEHIYRRHCSKFRCQRCQNGFHDVEELLAHNAADSCQEKDKADCLQSPDLSDAQVSEIRKRARKSRTEEEKWQDLYRMLFPEDTAVPSPYYGVVDIVQPCHRPTGSSTDTAAEQGFEAYLTRGLPPAKRRELVTTVQRHVSNATDDSLGQRVTDALLDIHRQLVSSYNQSLSLSRSTSSTAPSLAGEELRTIASGQGPYTYATALKATDPVLLLPSEGIPTDGVLLSSCWKGHGKESDLLTALEQQLADD
ncbi:hypothetical protein CONLIGDRAFT_112684 [Coniochaeta ligniaria NRRL 30616]|uniref:C2H2-type domain-containing protein n=1 Tax=Coniochaeta ligniaria NRRL 30616 TaxID=1408157 RepID=A0A1J7IRY5_9PEZI|nr:hypothetical protein CONLIGDRAFT_112684 [Coniochaeta ligniaria NRRL 30616]